MYAIIDNFFSSSTTQIQKFIFTFKAILEDFKQADDQLEANLVSMTFHVDDMTSQILRMNQTLNDHVISNHSFETDTDLMTSTFFNLIPVVSTLQPTTINPTEITPIIINVPSSSQLKLYRRKP